MSQLRVIFNEYFINADAHNALVEVLYYVGAFEKEMIEKHFKKLGFLSEVCDENNCQTVEDVNYFLNLIRSANCHAILEKNNPKHNCDANAILQGFHFKNIHHSIDWLKIVTQERLYARIGERWHTKTPEWMVEYAAPLAKLVQELRLTSEIMPKNHIADAAAFFGATGVEVEKRLKCINEKIEYNQISIQNRIYLLTGKRYIDISESGMKRDKGVDYLSTLSNKLNENLEGITEAMIMRDVSYSLFHTTFNIDDIITVNGSNAAGKDRPNTITTLEEFARVVHNDDKKILFISRNPNIMPQREDVIKVMSELAPNIEYEVIGCGLDNNELLNIESNVHRILMPLAGAIYSGYDRVKKNLETFDSGSFEIQHDEL